jgi:hypothetical protein
LENPGLQVTGTSMNLLPWPTIIIDETEFDMGILYRRQNSSWYARQSLACGGHKTKS